MKNRTLDHRVQYDEKYKLTSLAVSPHFPIQFHYLLKWAAIASDPLHILDLGGGTGEYSLLLQSMGHKVTLVDISPVAVEKACSIGVRNAVCSDYLSYPPEGIFDIVLSKGFSPLNTDDSKTFREVLGSIESLLRPKGVLLYWSATDLSQQWSLSGWFNWLPSTLREFFDEVQVCPIFRYQARLPVAFNRRISRVVEKRWLIRKSMTCIAYLRVRK